MKLEETIKMMREKNDDNKFYPLIEGMKRRASKGLLEGITPDDIEAVVRRINNEEVSIEKEVSIIQEMFEINEAIEKFNYLDIDSYDESLLEELIVDKFFYDIDLAENASYLTEEEDDFDTEEEDRNAAKKKRKKIINGTTAGISAAGATAGLVAGTGALKLAKVKTAAEKAALANTAGIELAKSNASKNAVNSYLNQHLHGRTAEYIANKGGEAAIRSAANAAGETAAAGAKDAFVKNATDTAAKNAGDSVWKAGARSIGSGLKNVGSAMVAPFKHLGGAITNSMGWTSMAVNPLLAGIGGGLAIAGGYGAYKLIKHLRKKRQEKALTEGIYFNEDTLFSSEVKEVLKEAISLLSESEYEYLKEYGCDDTKEILSMFRENNQMLEESVTFIDNAGNLKTTSTPDYVKSMHEYDTDTQIAKYEKKKKRRDYKLISEEIDIDGIKKLSEMSFEDILNEDLLS